MVAQTSSGFLSRRRVRSAVARNDMGLGIFPERNETTTVRSGNVIAFSAYRAKYPADYQAHWATGKREWCFSCASGGKEIPPAIRLCAAFSSERTGQPMVQLCTASAGSKRVVLQRPEILSKNGEQQGRRRMRSNNRFRRPYQVLRSPGDTIRGTPGQRPIQTLLRICTLPDTYLPEPECWLWGIVLSSSWIDSPAKF
jgi:hypothetical protein